MLSDNNDVDFRALLSNWRNGRPSGVLPIDLEGAFITQNERRRWIVNRRAELLAEGHTIKSVKHALYKQYLKLFPTSAVQDFYINYSRLFESDGVDVPWTDTLDAALVTFNREARRKPKRQDRQPPNGQFAKLAGLKGHGHTFQERYRRLMERDAAQTAIVSTAIPIELSKKRRK
jgi:hypothetical protein